MSVLLEQNFAIAGDWTGDGGLSHQAPLALATSFCCKTFRPQTWGPFDEFDSTTKETNIELAQDRLYKKAPPSSLLCPPETALDSGDTIDGKLCFVTTGYLLQRLVNNPEAARWQLCIVMSVKTHGSLT